MDEKHHPILERPWEYCISAIRWGERDEGETFLDVAFAKGEAVRNLRFERSKAESQVECSRRKGGPTKPCS